MFNDVHSFPIGRSELTSLAEAYGTPLLVLFPEVIREEALRIMHDLGPGFEVHFAAKSASSPSFFYALLETGISLDVASEYEYAICEHIGFSPERLFFYSPGAHPDFLARLLYRGSTVTIDSLHQIDSIIQLRRKPNGRIFLRVSPRLLLSPGEAGVIGVGANKFGLQERDLFIAAERLSKAGVPACGLHAHVGSLVQKCSVYSQLASELSQLADDIEGVHSINLGGGMSVSYPYPDNTTDFSFQELAAIIGDFERERKQRNLKPLKYFVEPGRSISARGAIMVSVVLDRKPSTDGTFFVIVDARLASIGLSLPVLNLSRDHSQCLNDIIVGTMCAPFDRLTETSAPECEIGDFLAFGMVGAYAVTPEGHLQLRPKAREVVWYSEGHHKIFREPSSISDYLRIVL